jgi:hypothetical protein
LVLLAIDARMLDLSTAQLHALRSGAKFGHN